jgi:hypothetical protein
MKFRQFALPAVLCLGGILAAGLFGCGGNSVGPNTTSQVRVFNALVNTPPVGVDMVVRDVTSTPLASGLAFAQLAPGPGSTATGYFVVASGGNPTIGTGVDFDAYAHGAETNNVKIAHDNFLLDPHTAGQTNGTYTVVVGGDANATAGSAAAPFIQRYFDAVNIPSGTTSAYVRVINLATDTPSSGLSIANNGQAITGMTGIVYRGTTSSNGTEYVALTVTAGQPFNFSVLNNVNTPIPTQTNISSITLQAGHAYTIFLVGDVSGTPQHFDVAIAQDFPTTATP